MTKKLQPQRQSDLKREQPSIQQRQPALGLLAEAAMLLALLSVLAFQELRVEGYEAEKIGLLGILAAVILGANIGLLWEHRTRWKTYRSQLQHPLIIAVALLLLVALISTVLALSGSRSLWGSPSRSQGLLTLLIYAVLFAQAIRSGWHGLARVVPILTLASIPICLWAIVSFLSTYSNRLHAGSTTGNPNYLSSWLTMVLLYCAPQLYWEAKSWRRPFSGIQRLQAELWVITLILIVVTLLITGSRGALLGLMTGLIADAIILSVVLHSRRLLSVIIASVVIFTVLYVGANRLTANVSNLDGFARILQPMDQERLKAWDAAVVMLQRQAEPLNSADGTPDRWARLRPLFGYGLDNTEQIQVRYGDAVFFGGTTFLDRFHNVEFDTLAMLGWLGLITWGLIQLAVVNVGLRWLGILRAGQWKQLLVWQFSGIAAGTLLVPLAISPANIMPIMPVGGAVGGIASSFLWIALQIRTPPEVVLDRFKLAVISIICIVVAQLIDNQFGFVQAATQPLFWVLLGGFVTLTRHHPEFYDDHVAEDALDRSSWYQAGIGVGLFFIFSLGVSLTSRYINHDTGTNTLPFLLAAMLVATLLNSSASNGKLVIRRTLQQSALLIGVWAIFFAAKLLIRQTVSPRLDSALIAITTASTETLKAPFIFLGITGVMLLVIGLFVFMPLADVRRIKHGEILPIVVGFLLGTILYTSGFSSSILHQVGNLFRDVGSPEGLIISDKALQAGLELAPQNTRMRLHELYTLVAEIKTTTDQNRNKLLKDRLSQQIDTLLNVEPFFVNSREWRDFFTMQAAANR